MMQMTPEDIMYACFCGRTDPVNFEASKTTDREKKLKSSPTHPGKPWTRWSWTRSCRPRRRELPDRRWRRPRSALGSRYPERCPAPLSSCLRGSQRRKVSGGNDGLNCPVEPERWRTIGSGRVSLCLICADEHGESWIRNVEALKS